MRLVGLFLCCLGLGLAGEVQSCSLPESYRVPTNLELTAMADVIAIARVRSGPDITAAPLLLTGVIDRLPSVKFDLLHILKGKTDRKRVEAPDPSLVIKSKEAMSDAEELTLAHPDSYGHGCRPRSIYVWNAMIVLFLKRDQLGDLSLIGHGSAREAEDVPHLNARWVRAVKEYIAISPHPRAQWPSALHDREVALRKAGERDALAIADDMVRQIGAQRQAADEIYEDDMSALERLDIQSKRFNNAVQKALSGVTF